jgi:hypothetical protein
MQIMLATLMTELPLAPIYSKFVGPPFHGIPKNKAPPQDHPANQSIERLQEVPVRLFG